MSDDRAREEAAPTLRLRPSQVAKVIAAAPALAAGTVLAGRYRIDRFLARGGMGAVYEAFDRDLGVTVALKTVRPDVAWDVATVERFKREIQLARAVTHPGVCRIFDLGRHGEELVFLTMELLRGPTLADRIAEAGRVPLAEATTIVVQLMDALAAAHAAGVIHRDLKPSNVILAERGGVRRPVITDFGLARELAHGSVVEGGAAGAGEPGATGFAGTPAYMAPEQITGAGIGPATDLFAIGVVMVELVTGALPWATGDGPRTVDDARLDALEPRWGAAVRRCLANAPADRFGSAAELADAIAPSPPRGRGRGPIVAVAAGAVAIAAGLAYARRAGPRGDAAVGREDPCAEVGRALDGVWDAGRRAAVADAFAAAQQAEAHARVAGVLDRQAARWIDLQRDLCRDRAARRAPSDELAARGRCLDRGLISLRALTGQLVGRLDAATAVAAVAVVDAIEPLERCADAGALHALAQGRLEQGELAAAEATVRDAIRLAAQVGDDVALARCWVTLVRALVQLGRIDEASSMGAVAEAAVVRAGDDPRLALDLQANLAEADAWQHRYDRAIPRLAAALASAEATLGPRDPKVIETQVYHAEILDEVGRSDEALALAQRAHGAAAERFGTHDLRYATAHYVIGLALRELGRLDEARPYLEDTLAATAALDPTHPARFHVRLELGRFYLLTGERDRAVAMLEEALAVARSLSGPDLVRIGFALGELGNAHLARGDRVRAEAAWREALELRRRARGERSVSAGYARAALGALAAARGARTEAIELLELAVQDLAHPPVQASLAIAQVRLARLLWSDPAARPRARALAAAARPDLHHPPGDRVIDLDELRAWAAKTAGSPDRSP